MTSPAHPAIKDSDAPHTSRPRQRTSERPPRLLLLAAAPTLWAAHFLASYITAALWCAKAALGVIAGTDKSLSIVAALIVGYTVAALAGVALVTAIGITKLRVEAVATSGEASARPLTNELLGPGEPYDGDSDHDRTRFLGFATLLLCGLSAVGIIFAALVVVFLRDCR